MPNFSIQAPTYYAGVKSYDDRSFINFWTIQTKDQLLNKLYFSNSASFAATTANTPLFTTTGLQKSTAPLKPVVSWTGFNSSYSTSVVNPYLIDSTLPIFLGSSGVVSQIVDWNFLSTDWFRSANYIEGSAAGKVEIYLYTDTSTTTGIGYKIEVTPTTATTVAVGQEVVSDFQLAVGTYAGQNCTSVVSVIGTPTGTNIKAVKIVNPSLTATSKVTPAMVYQANNRYQFPGASINYRVCCIDNFEWTREFDKAERTCSGKVTSNEITKETNTINLTIKEEDAIIWGLMTGQMPSIESATFLTELSGYAKGNTNLVPSTGIIPLPTKPNVVSVTTKDCANLQQVSNLTNNVILGGNDYSYNPVTGELKVSPDLAGQSISIIVSQVADVTKVNLVPLTDGYRGYLEVQRRGKNDRLKITRFANVSLTMPTISADEAGDTLEMELDVSNTTAGDISILFV